MKQVKDQRRDVAATHEATRRAPLLGGHVSPRNSGGGKDQRQDAAATPPRSFDCWWHSGAEPWLILALALVALVVLKDTADTCWAEAADGGMRIEAQRGIRDSGLGTGEEEEQDGGLHPRYQFEDSRFSTVPLQAADAAGEAYESIRTGGRKHAATPAWQVWLFERGRGDDTALLAAIEAASAESGVDPAALVATIEVETACRHYRRGGVIRGDAGEIGIAQVMPSPWQRHFSGELGREVDLYCLEDNLLCCALLLVRGGWHGNLEEGNTPAERAYAWGYYNTGRERITEYSHKAERVYQEILAEGGRP